MLCMVFLMLVYGLFNACILQIDMTALRQMGDKDLKELGIPMVIPFPWPSTIFKL